ncbi:hypothetical protein ACP70R_008355 [Stipagrostis hirtigluma subsp. patula]
MDENGVGHDDDGFQAAPAPAPLPDAAAAGGGGGGDDGVAAALRSLFARAAAIKQQNPKKPARFPCLRCFLDNLRGFLDNLRAGIVKCDCPFFDLHGMVHHYRIIHRVFMAEHKGRLHHCSKCGNNFRDN